MMSMVGLKVIDMKTSKTDNKYSLEKYLGKLIYMNSLMVLYLTINQVDLH